MSCLWGFCLKQNELGRGTGKRYMSCSQTNTQIKVSNDSKSLMFSLV